MVSYINASPLEFVKTLTGSTDNFRYNISFNEELEADEEAKEKEAEVNLDDTLGADTIKSKVSVFSNYSNFHNAAPLEGKKEDKFTIFFDQLKDRYVIQEKT